MSSMLDLELVKNKIEVSHNERMVTLRFHISGVDALKEAARREVNSQLREKSRLYAEQEPAPEQFVNARDNLLKAEGEIAELRRDLQRAGLDRETLVFKSSGTKSGEQLAKRLAEVDKRIAELKERIVAVEPGLQSLRESTGLFEDHWARRFERAVVRAAEELRTELQSAERLSVTHSSPADFLEDWLRYMVKLGRVQGVLARDHGAYGLATEFWPEHSEMFEKMKPDGYNAWAA